MIKMLSLTAVTMALALGRAVIAEPSAPLSDRSESSIPRPRFGNVPYGVDITACTAPGTVALSFDDGPDQYTNDLLDLLQKNNVLATFFITGTNGDDGPINDPSSPKGGVLRRMLAEGHHIGSHSWSHLDMDEISSEEGRDEIIKNELAFTDLFGFFPTYYRPPFTHCANGCFGLLQEFGYHILNYNLDTKDWEVDVSQAKSNYDSLLSYFNPQSSGVISLAHDIHPTTVYELAQFMIDKARSKGYSLVTVGECLGDPEVNWYRDAKSGEPVDEARIRNAGAKTPTTTSATPTPTTTSVKTTSTSTASATAIAQEQSTTLSSTNPARPSQTSDVEANNSSDHGNESPEDEEKKDDESTNDASAASSGAYPLGLLLCMALWLL